MYQWAEGNGDVTWSSNSNNVIGTLNIDRCKKILGTDCDLGVTLH